MNTTRMLLLHIERWRMKITIRLPFIHHPIHSSYPIHDHIHLITWSIIHSIRSFVHSLGRLAEGRVGLKREAAMQKREERKRGERGARVRARARARKGAWVCRGSGAAASGMRNLMQQHPTPPPSPPAHAQLFTVAPHIPSFLRWLDPSSPFPTRWGGKGGGGGLLISMWEH